MKKGLLLTLSVLFFAQSSLAQSKKELQAEVERLKSELTQKDQEVVAAKKSESISVAKAEQFESQVSELKAANATLLENLKVFTEASQQRSTSIGQTLESLRDKEAKLKVIDDEFSKNDSIALLVLTGFKQTLGEDARVGVEKAAVIVELNKTSLFGSGADSSTLSDEGQIFIDKIAAVLSANPETEATVVSTRDTISESMIVSDRSAAIYSFLDQQVKTNKGRISVTSSDSGTESYRIRIHPKLNDFYLRVRETVKNNR